MLSSMDEDTDVHLRWNHHQTTLFSVFSSLLNNENLVDCTISAEGQHFKAHRVILSACSPYFELLFNEHCENHPIVILPDVQYQILEALMEFMYSGEVKVPENQLSIVLELANTLQIKGLSSAGDSQTKNSVRPKRRIESPVRRDQQCFKKHLSERRSGSQVKQKESVSSLDSLDNECSEDINSCLLGAQKCVKNSSNSVSTKNTVKEEAMLKGSCDTETFNVSQCSSASKTITLTSGTLFNSVSNILDTSQLSGPSKAKVRVLSENVISSHLTSEKLITSEPRGVYGETAAADFLPQMKQEDADDFNSNIIDEIVLDDDNEESDNHDRSCGSGSHNSSFAGGLTRVIPEHSFSGQGFCNREQIREPYSVEPAALLLKPFRCNACGRCYRYESSLLRHLKYECGKEPQFKCLQCPARFFHNYDLKVHTCMTHKVL